MQDKFRQRRAVFVVVVGAVQEVQPASLTADPDVGKARRVKFAIARVIQAGDSQLPVDLEWNSAEGLGAAREDGPRLPGGRVGKGGGTKGRKIDPMELRLGP